MEWTIQDYTNISLAGATIALAIFTIMLAIVTVFPSIFRERKEHYVKLYDNVFASLSNLIDYREVTEGLYFLKLLLIFPTISILYFDAEKHLEKDFRGLPERIKKFRDKVNEHNLQVDKFIGSLDPIIRKSFVKNLNALFIEERLFKIENYYIKEQIINCWRRTYNQFPNTGDEDQTISQILEQYIRNNIRFKFENNKIVIEPGTTIAYADNEADFQKFKTIFIENILKNQDLLKDIEKLKETKLSLEIEAESISSLVSIISNSIITGNYKTKAKFCPTFWRLFRNYGL